MDDYSIDGKYLNSISNSNYNFDWIEVKFNTNVSTNYQEWALYIPPYTDITMLLNYFGGIHKVQNANLINYVNDIGYFIVVKSIDLYATELVLPRDLQAIKQVTVYSRQAFAKTFDMRAFPNININIRYDKTPEPDSLNYIISEKGTKFDKIVNQLALEISKTYNRLKGIGDYGKSSVELIDTGKTGNYQMLEDYVYAEYIVKVVLGESTVRLLKIKGISLDDIDKTELKKDIDAIEIQLLPEDTVEENFINTVGKRINPVDRNIHRGDRGNGLTINKLMTEEMLNEIVKKAFITELLEENKQTKQKESLNQRIKNNSNKGFLGVLNMFKRD